MLNLLWTFALAGAACFEAARPLSADALIAPADVVVVVCDPARPAAPVRYDRAARGSRPATALPAGGYLGRIALSVERGVEKGAALTLRSSAGPIVIERGVTALQPGRSGERIFVQDAAGAVFAVELRLAPEAGQ